MKISVRLCLARFAATLALSVWLGGFAFYSGLVIPVLHGLMTSQESGRITQRVTDRLNLIGCLALAVAWGLELGARSGRSDKRTLRALRLRLSLLAVLSILLAGLAGLHEVMDRHLENYGLSGFYPLHRAYLIGSTLQWLAGVGLLCAWVTSWSRPPSSE